jgi:GNAT superfamily N-acetyltransferase
MDLRYDASRQISADEFIDLLKRSTLAERRPIEDRKCIEAMLRHADLLCTAWHGDTLVGVARSVTDFEYCCYLSDLAVDEAYQKKGIGKELIKLTEAGRQSENHPPGCAKSRNLLPEARVRPASFGLGFSRD